MRELGRSLIVVVVLTAVLGLAYPAAMVGFAHLSFADKANGSLISRDGRVIGSKLAAQLFTAPRYFHERPSATTPAYNPSATTFSNLGPASPVLAKLVRDRAAAILALERPYNPGLATGDLPVDAVTASASGIDPEISPAYARLQERRVAATRHLSLATVQQLVRSATHGRALGFIGEPGVNVLELNRALDSEAA
jgi:K+-transporting ATPase ATPase C chain